MPNYLKKALKFINPFRRTILGVLLVCLFVSTIYALNFENSANAESKRLNPRTSSISFEKVKIVEKEKTDKKKESTNNQQENKQPETAIKDKVSYKTIEIKEPKKINGENRALETPTPDQVKLIVTTGSNAGSYAIEIEEKMTGLELMEKAADEYGLEFNYSGSGTMAFVNSIGNLKNTITNEPGCQWSGRGWLIYLNNQITNIGIGQIIVKDKDQLTWNYEHYCY